MCGIAGIVNKNNETVSMTKLKRMTDIIEHRGPDAQGQWSESAVALGHRRLSIIDLSKESNQPMISNDCNYVITYNGEVYNYLEIREELKEKGVKFKTSSDTEVILEAYKAYGETCLQRFNGMWAFCIYDKIKNILFISRDRFGVKPLYYLENSSVFAFGSEAKEIIAAYPEENIPSVNGIYRYLANGGENLDELGYYQNIKIFPEAHYMIYDLTKHSQTKKNFWEVDEKQFYDKWIAGRNPVKTFKRLFDDAVQLRLRSDVEVGACLSGGLDSSAIVGCCHKKYNQRINTFSSIYQDKDCNEEEYIKEVNEINDTIPHYVYPDCEESDFNNHMNKIIFHHDGPVQGASLFSQYMVMKKIHNHVKVVLDGQGADEMFAGYIPYYSYLIDDLANKKGSLGKLQAIRTLVLIKCEWPEILGAISTDTIVSLVGMKNGKQFQNDKNFQNNQFRRSCPLFTKKFIEMSNDRLDLKPYQCSTKLNTQLCNDVIRNSIPRLLHNEDSNAMAFSIESRIPFLDYRLVEFSIALGENYKIRNGWTKWIVRKGCKRYLPDKVRKRKSKMGFPAPFARWLREGESKEDYKKIIFALGKRNIVPMDTIESFYEAHISNKTDMSMMLFKFYCLELWLRTCNPLSVLENN